MNPSLFIADAGLASGFAAAAKPREMIATAISVRLLS